MPIIHPAGFPIAASSDTAYSPSPTTLYGPVGYANIGDLAMLWVYLYPNGPNATTVTGTSTGTWTLSATSNNVGGWYGIYTAPVLTVASPDTITVAYSGSTSGQSGDLWIDCLSAGYGSLTQWSIVATGNNTGNGVTSFTYPSLTSATTANPQAYVGWSANSGRATGGTTAGFTYIDATASSGSEQVFNLGLSSNTAYAPSSTCGSGDYDTLAMIVEATPPSFAIYHVQDITPAVGNYTAATVSTAGTAFTVGNWLIVITTSAGTGPVTPTGGGVGTWLHAASISGSCDLWYGKVTSSGQTTVTAPYVTGDYYPIAVGGEFGGLASSPLISSGSVTNTSASVITQALAASSGQLWVGGGFSNAGVPSPYTPTTGFTNFPSGCINSGANQYAFNQAGWQVITTPGTYQNNYTANGSSPYFTTCAVFAPPASHPSMLAFF